MGTSPFPPFQPDDTSCGAEESYADFIVLSIAIITCKLPNKFNSIEQIYLGVSAGPGPLDIGELTRRQNLSVRICDEKATET